MRGDERGRGGRSGSRPHFCRPVWLNDSEVAAHMSAAPQESERPRDREA